MESDLRRRGGGWGAEGGEVKEQIEYMRWSE
jgi:hypothetical protein